MQPVTDDMPFYPYYLNRPADNLLISTDNAENLCLVDYQIYGSPVTHLRALEGAESITSGEVVSASSGR